VAGFFRMLVDQDGIIDAILAYVREPRASVRNAMSQTQELRDSAAFPLPWALVDAMVLDGVEDRQDVADLIHWVFSRGHYDDEPGATE
jgi:hypothetical protein